MQSVTVAKIGLTAAVVLGGLGFLAYSSTEQAQHYMMVDGLIRDGFERWKDRGLKVHGWVADGTIVRAVVSQEAMQTFVLQKDGKRIRVFANGPMPDTFKDGAEVVATGRLVPARERQDRADQLCACKACQVRADAEQTMVLEASDVSAKCAMHYDGAAVNKTQRPPVFQ